MKITFLDNNTHNISLTSAAGWTGYRAKSIELNGADVKTMRQIYEGNPLEFDKYLLQLEARFPENYPTPVPFQVVAEKPYRCGPCGSTDPTKYTRCNHAGCPDGRDR